MPRIADSLAALLVRRPGLALAVGLGLTALAVLPAGRFRLDTDLANLLPEGTPAADDYRLFLRTFGGFEKVFVVVRAELPGVDSAQLAEAAGRLAETMAASALVADARSGLTDEDERFFLEVVAPRLPLLLDRPGWKEDLAGRLQPDAIAARVAQMRQAVRGPTGSFLGRLFASDPLGLSEGLLSAAGSLPVDPLTGAFLSPGGDASLVILTPASSELDPAGGRALIFDLERAYAAVERETGVALDFAALGGPLYAAQDEALIRADLTRTVTASAVGVSILLLLGFGGAFVPGAIVASVVAGLVWTVAAASLGLGEMTVVGIGFAAALLGMGVEYGIHGGARFAWHRGEGTSAAEALRLTLRDPGPGIVSSALTTAAGLGALCLAHFRPLREIGQVLTAGVLLTLVTTALVGGALLVLFPARTAKAREPRLWLRFGLPALQATTRLATRRPWAVLGPAVLLTGVAAWGLGRLDLSADLRSMRPSDHPATAAENLLVDSFGVGLDTLSVVAPGASLGEALDHASAARGLLAARLGASAQITSPADWLPSDVRLRSRLGELASLPLIRAADDFERDLARAGFRLEPFAPALSALRALGEGRDPGAPPPAAWPRFLRELVRVTPEGAAVAVHVRLPLAGDAGAASEALAAALYQISPELALASVPRMGASLRALAFSDLARSSSVAAALVAAVVLVTVGWRLGDALLASVPLVLGCLWTFGLWGAAGGRVDLLAISALPVLFGVGIDLGVHAVYGGRLRPEEGIRGTLERMGLAMALVATTTAVGFGSLGSSRVPGIENAGSLVALGVLACLAATWTVLPALAEVAGRRRTRR